MNGEIPNKVHPAAPNIRAGELVSLAVLGHIMGFSVTLTAARLLSVGAFETYVVAGALFILLATAAPLGSETYPAAPSSVD